MKRGIHKQKVKQILRRLVGEPHVGKRLKMRNLGPAIDAARLSPSRILDAGSGDAAFTYWLADRFPDAQVTSVDVDETAVNNCRAAMPARYCDRVVFEVTPFHELPAEHFDLVVSLDVLEHIVDDGAAVDDLVRSLQPGGSLILHVPRDVWTHRNGRRERVADEDAWRINEGHVRMGYSPELLSEMVRSRGCEVVAVDLWLRRFGVIAHELYSFVERVVPLRLLTMPFTDVAALLDRRRPPEEGNTVFLRAQKPLRSV